MDDVALLDRHDTKYIFSREELVALLPQLQEHYRVLEVDGNRASLYRSLYFDSENLDFYSLHQRGKKNRIKIRMRKYVHSKLTFLEVKLKNNKGRTVKSRMEIDDINETLSPANISFIHDAVGEQNQLEASIFNEFHRITLVHKVEQERLTLDIQLKFKTPDGQVSNMNQLVVAELKQDVVNRYSPFAKLTKEMLIRPERLSKYCLGIALLIDDAKKNRIKRKLLRIAKISGDQAA